MMRPIFAILFSFVLYPVFARTEVAIFAGGCFWCLEADFDKLSGVIATLSGFDGGTQPNPSYNQVSQGKTDYAESVKVIFDTNEVSYRELVEYFWRQIDPTVANAQFCDKGRQYRSAIFYLTPKQKKTALASKHAINDQFVKVYTKITPSTRFYPAAEYHQNYYQKNPLRYRFYRTLCGRDQRLKSLWGNKQQ